MKYVSLSGGLGNQIFQAIFAQVLSYRVEDVVIDDSRQERVVEHPESRLFDFMNLAQIRNVNKLPFAEIIRRALEITSTSTTLRFLNKRTGLYGAEVTKLGTFYEKPGTEYSLMLEHLHHESIVRYVGYFQSSFFFDSLSETDKMVWRDLTKTYREGLELLELEKSAVIHVRRGDYRTSKKLDLLQPKWYEAAVKNLGNFAQGYIVSDEPFSSDVCNIQAKTGFRVLSELNPIQTLSAISGAKARVIANSSLSFAAAIFADEKTTTVAPARWGSGSAGEDNRNERYRGNWIIQA